MVMFGCSWISALVFPVIVLGESLYSPVGCESDPDHVKA